ncbi:MAG TPA: glycosyl hydrolase [Solirubrobacterales bacterium]|nr:glycosyl hydrolase [Solirubrobacterales bacterium]
MGALHRSVVLLVAALTLLAFAAAATAKPPTRYWGAWVGSQLTGKEAPWDMTAAHSLEGDVGYGMSLLQFSAPFAKCEAGSCAFYTFPTAEMEKIRAHGSIPVFSWNSGASGGDPDDFQLSDLNSGRYDAYVHDFARAAAAWGHPFFLRFNWEMNGDWFPWGAGVNGNTAAEFRSAWRRVHEIFRGAGATNGTWVWCPYANSTESLRLRPFYPGDRFVDWTCLDTYNWGPESPQPTLWRSFRELVEPTYRRITERIAPGKPMLIGEVATTGTPAAKAYWIHGMFAAVRHRFEKIRGLVWFNKVDGSADWPLDSWPAASAFGRELRLGFTQNVYAAIQNTPIPPPGAAR